MSHSTDPAAPTMPLPDFSDPPVVEVALAVAFNPISGLRTLQIGDLWRQAYRDRYPHVEEQPPVQPQVESFPSSGPGLSVSFELARTIPLPRLWFVDSGSRELVQVQNNWFARNWRQTEDGGPYPRFPALVEAFEVDLQRFATFVKDSGLGDVEPTSVEITYTNHVTDAEVARLEHVMSLLEESAPEFLPPPEVVRFAAQYVITGDGATPLGRLYISAEPAIRRSDGGAINVLTVTARGGPMGPGLGGVMAFLAEAHDWVVRAFAASTRVGMHEKWGRTDDR